MPNVVDAAKSQGKQKRSGKNPSQPVQQLNAVRVPPDKLYNEQSHLCLSSQNERAQSRENLLEKEQETVQNIKVKLDAQNQTFESH